MRDGLRWKDKYKFPMKEGKKADPGKEISDPKARGLEVYVLFGK